jgi:quercetin dioxygenase-like cupin family protein
MIVKTTGDFKWEGVDVLPYKEDGNMFRDVTRQVMFEGTGDLPVEFRYFEVGPGGHSTLERHEHQHAVMVIRGRGRVLVRDSVTPICCQDIVHIPPMTWHQFRADEDSPLGFLCIVACERDRPQRPCEAELEYLRSSDVVREFIQI